MSATRITTGCSGRSAAWPAADRSVNAQDRGPLYGGAISPPNFRFWAIPASRDRAFLLFHNGYVLKHVRNHRKQVRFRVAPFR